MAGATRSGRKATVQALDESQWESAKNQNSDLIGDLMAPFESGEITRKTRKGRPRRATINPSPFSSSGFFVPPRPAREVDSAQGLRFLFDKRLKTSDVSMTARIVIPKNFAEKYLPPLHVKEGMFMNMADMDGLHEWSFRFRYWPNNRSRMYVLENTRDFIKTHGLDFGDRIMLYKDDPNEKYVIRAWKAFDPEVYSLCTRNDSLLPEVEMLQSSIFQDSLLPMNQLASTSSYYFEEYDTILHDFPMELSCESMPDFPRLEELPSFSTFDFSLDDFE